MCVWKKWLLSCTNQGIIYASNQGLYCKLIRSIDREWSLDSVTNQRVTIEHILQHGDLLTLLFSILEKFHGIEGQMMISYF